MRMACTEIEVYSSCRAPHPVSHQSPASGIVAVCLLQNAPVRLNASTRNRPGSIKRATWKTTGATKTRTRGGLWMIETYVRQRSESAAAFDALLRFLRSLYSWLGIFLLGTSQLNTPVYRGAQDTSRPASWKRHRDLQRATVCRSRLHKL